MVQKTHATSKLPDFTTHQETAAFWDSHDSTEFEDEFEPVELEVALPLLHGFAIYFEGEVFDRIAAAANRRGIGFSTLAGEWVVEALERDEAASR